MFYYSATEKLVAGKTIQIFNYSNCKRDFTYIDDIVEGVYRVMQGAPEKANGEDGLPLPPYAVYNIGGGTPENQTTSAHCKKNLSELVYCLKIMTSKDTVN